MENNKRTFFLLIQFSEKEKDLTSFSPSLCALPNGKCICCLRKSGSCESFCAVMDVLMDASDLITTILLTSFSILVRQEFTLLCRLVLVFRDNCRKENVLYKYDQ